MNAIWKFCMTGTSLIMLVLAFALLLVVGIAAYSCNETINESVDRKITTD
jgi:hypothetical protein